MTKLIMTREQFHEIQYLTKICPKEISGMGTLIIDKDDNLVVEKLFLLDQEVSGASTDLDANSVQACMYEARECQGSLSFWWHSHVNMQAFFSGTDVETIKDHSKHGLFCGLVINKRGEYKIGLGLKSPRVYIDQGIELCVSGEEFKELESRLDIEYKKKVKEKVYSFGNSVNLLDDKFADQYEKGAKYNKNKNKNKKDSKDKNKKEEKVVIDDTKYNFNKLNNTDKNNLSLMFAEDYGRNPISIQELEEYHNDLLLAFNNN